MYQQPDYYSNYAPNYYDYYNGRISPFQRYVPIIRQILQWITPVIAIIITIITGYSIL